MGRKADRQEFFEGSLRNHFLIAMPGLRESPFANSVTYICDHDSGGAMGLVINRTMEISLSEVFDQMELEYNHEEVGRIPILAGGPVSTQRGFVLHPTGGHWQSSMQIAPEISLTASRDIITALASGEGPQSPLFVLGYAGWDNDQLEQEIRENSWLTVPADFDILFNTPIEQRWVAAARSLGVDMNLMPTTAGHA